MTRLCEHSIHSFDEAQDSQGHTKQLEGFKVAASDHRPSTQLVLGPGQTHFPPHGAARHAQDAALLWNYEYAPSPV